jgi:hypothetical protein
MVTKDQAGVRGALLHAGHPRIAIRVGKINVSRDENLLVIRASREQDECAQNEEFSD